MRPCRQLTAGVEGELAQDAVDVDVHRSHRKEQSRRDLAIRQPARDQLCDFGLACGKRGSDARVPWLFRFASQCLSDGPVS